MAANAFGKAAAGVLLGPALGAPPSHGDPSLESRVRKPVALAFADGGKLLLVANRGSGTVSVIDVASAKVAAEWGAGRGLADLAPLADGAHMLAVDQDANKLLLLE